MANNSLIFNGVHGNNYDLYINSSLLYWNGSSFVFITTSRWTAFAIAGSEQDTTGIFGWTMPSLITAGPGYGFTVRQRLSTNAAPTDPIDGNSQFSWDGTNSGTWVQGDICYNTGVASGQPEGWRCTAGGSPGTWSVMNNHP